MFGTRENWQKKSTSGRKESSKNQEVGQSWAAVKVALICHRIKTESKRHNNKVRDKDKGFEDLIPNISFFYKRNSF